MSDKFVENILGQICTELFSFQEKFEYLGYYVRAYTEVTEDNTEGHKQFAGDKADEGSTEVLDLLYKIGLIIGNDVMQSKDNAKRVKDNA